jgi:hypothetical protein
MAFWRITVVGTGRDLSLHPYVLDPWHSYLNDIRGCLKFMR